MNRGAPFVRFAPEPLPPSYPERSTRWGGPVYLSGPVRAHLSGPVRAQQQAPSGLRVRRLGPPLPDYVSRSAPQVAGPLLPVFSAKEAKAYADRLDTYVDDLDADQEATLAYSTQDPAELFAKYEKAAKLPGASPAVLAKMKDEAARLAALQKGKSPEQIKAEASFASAWRKWRADWDDWYTRTATPWQTSATKTPTSGDWSYMEAAEAQIMEWRKRYESLGYKPSKPAPTSKEIDANIPKKELPGEGMLKSIANAVPWVAGAMVAVSLVGLVRR